MSEFLRKSSSVVLPWSTWPMMVTTGGLSFIKGSSLWLHSLKPLMSVMSSAYYLSISLFLGLIICVRSFDSVVLKRQAMLFGVDGNSIDTGCNCTFKGLDIIENGLLAKCSRPVNIVIIIIHRQMLWKSIFCEMKKRVGTMPKLSQK